MTLDQLEALQTVVEMGSFRAAAEKLAKSQPALSISIKNLEEELGLTIFDRTTYRPRLTPSGEAFLTFAKKTLESARYAKRVGIELGQQSIEPEIKISVDPLISMRHLRHITETCAKPTHAVNLVLEKSILHESHDRLLKGELDLAIAPNAHRHAGVESVTLEEVVLVGAIRKTAVRTRSRSLITLPQIVIAAAQTEDFLPSSKLLETSHKIFAPDHFTKLRLIEEGLGWGRISKTELRKNRELTQVDKTLCPEVTLELCLLRPKNRPIGPTARAIWEHFQMRSSPPHK